MQPRSKVSVPCSAAAAMLRVCVVAMLPLLACNTGAVTGADYDGGAPQPPCKGTDKDGDGYGTGCSTGNDCDDSDAMVNPGMKELCNGKDDNCNGVVDEGAKNACGNCAQTCASVGKGAPFPTASSQDPNVKDVNGVGLEANGDLVLKASAMNFNYMWIANTYDSAGSSTCGSGQTTNSKCRGTISKVDTDKMREVARYYTITCHSQGLSKGTCTDVNGKSITANHNHTPSRTAVDYNFDVWVANRSVHGGQPSATKIANDVYDCIDRNKNNKIDTSKDHNGDGSITMDCNGDGVADSGSTKCSGAYASNPPEFLGDDDECIIMTTNYGDSGDVGRSICLDMGKGMVGASSAWVGTYSREDKGRGPNRFYKIDGNTGKIAVTVDMPSGHRSYGCMADGHNIVWSTDIYGTLSYLQTVAPYSAGKLLTCPWYKKTGKTYHHYGIAVDGTQHIWLGGYNASWVLRYKPNRSSFATLGSGAWTRIDVTSGQITRGIAVDNRGFVWVAIQDGGYVLRLAQNKYLGDGVYSASGTKDLWPVTAETVIGVGVDFKGNVWAVGHKNNIASRLDVDSAGNVTATGTKNNVKIGQNPYTYSDFTGFGLMNFVRPSGRYVYQLHPCPAGYLAQWKEVSWTATTPTGTAVQVRARSGDSDTTFGSWVGPFATTPADISKGTANQVLPNPSTYIQVEFTLTNRDKSSSPTLHDFGVSYSCFIKAN